MESKKLRGKNLRALSVITILIIFLASKSNLAEAKVIESKGNICKQIFQLIPKMCQSNPVNQKHFFDMLPPIKFHVIIIILELTQIPRTLK